MYRKNKNFCFKYFVINNRLDDNIKNYLTKLEDMYKSEVEIVDVEYIKDEDSRNCLLVIIVIHKSV